MSMLRNIISQSRSGKLCLILPPMAKPDKFKPSYKEFPHGSSTYTTNSSCIVFRFNRISLFFYHIFFLCLMFQTSLCVASNPNPTNNIFTTTPPTHSLSTISPSGHVITAHHTIEPKFIVASSVVFAVLLALVVFMAFLRCFGVKLKGGKSSKVVVLQENHVGDLGNGGCEDKEDCNGMRRYSWYDIKMITMNFSQVVATGGFSTVYLAQLPSFAIGAVKVHSGGQRLNEAFKQELDILLRLDHENIVKLLGYSDEKEEEGALVFEYVPNGNLQERLHGGSEYDGIVRKQRIPWKNRMVIAYQLAQAIEYLHEKCPLQIVHGDIKSSNILLDEKLNCKLCDFGFAKMGFSSTIFPPPESPGVHRSPRTKQVMGSLGYADPQYLRTGIASKKNDVYSFGVVILELVTGKEAFCSESGGMLTSIMVPTLKEFGNDQNQSKMAEMVDPMLAGHFDLEEVRAMLSLATMCLGQTATLRPSASQILQTIRDKVPSISSLDSSGKDSCKPFTLHK